MSRAQKRMEARMAKHKPNRSKAQYNTSIQLEFDAFDTIDRMFLAIRNGALEWEPSGFVIKGISGEYMHVLSALQGWIAYWAALAEHLKLDYSDAALVKLAKSLEYEKPMQPAEVEAAYAVVNHQRQFFRNIPQPIRKRVCDQVRDEIAKENEIRELLKVKVAA